MWWLLTQRIVAFTSTTQFKEWDLVQNRPVSSCPDPPTNNPQLTRLRFSFRCIIWKCRHTIFNLQCHQLFVWNLLLNLASCLLWQDGQRMNTRKHFRNKRNRRLWIKIYYRKAPYMILATHPKFADIIDVSQEAWDQLPRNIQRMFTAAYDQFMSKRMQ